MPPNTIMRGGTLPLGSLLTFKSKSKSAPPPEFTQAFLLDSTRLLSGLLVSHGNIEYAIATSGSKTVISRPVQSANVAVIEWKGGWIETEGLRLNRNEWVDESKWISARTHLFKKWGRNPEIRWETKNGEWQAINPKKQVLAAFIIRRGALGTRIELTDAGKPYASALVLTGVLTVIDGEEWKWHDFLVAQRDLTAARGAAGSTSEGAAREHPTQQPEENLPTYREAPFTRPLGPLISPPSNPSDQEDDAGLLTDRPLKLTLASKHPLNGTWYEDDQPVMRIHTTGPRTTVSRVIHNSRGVEPSVRVVGTIHWAEGKATVLGKDVELDSMFGKAKNSVFSKASRKSEVCTLPTLISHWSITPETSSASIYPNPNTYIRYECRITPPQNRPLALLMHYLKRKGTVMELTPEGHGALIEVFIGALVLMYGTTREWKKVTGVGRDVGREGLELVLGEEMVSDLDGWAGPVELMRLRQQEVNGTSD
ncbi:unnamed protein product [Rhizoctonia solani]|uniref:Uncharacterized protein n=1 Tax=Rhizoctonia solani TaxID=456999 RepID=A0A8H3CBT8_9AGAM|nr:unnamed protein product [Rhizoctonia solani]